MSEERTTGIDRLCGLLEEIMDKQDDILIQLDDNCARLQQIEERLGWLDEDDDELVMPDPMDIIKDVVRQILDRQEPFAKDAGPIMRAIRESSR